MTNTSLRVMTSLKTLKNVPDKNITKNIYRKNITIIL